MPVVDVEYDTTRRCKMDKVEIYDTNEQLLMTVDAPFVPIAGEYISIERDDFFRYYRVEERWLRIKQDNAVTGCVRVTLED